MITKQKIQIYRSLKESQEIREQGIFMVEGVKTCLMAVEHYADKVETLLVDSSRYDIEVYKDFCHNYQNIEVVSINARDADLISSLKTSPGIMAICRVPAPFLFDSNAPKSIYLHEIVDPGNLGTIIRTAEWFGIDQILLSSKSVYQFHPKVVQASMGSIFKSKVVGVTNEELQNIMPQTISVAMDISGQKFESKSLIKANLVLFGSESHGLPPDILDWSKEVLKIENAKYSIAESLNVAITAGIICAQW